jgi:hypothetical protein
MNAMLVIFGGLVGFLVLYAIALGMWSSRSGVQIVGRSLRNEAAEAEIEEHDIDEMIDALNARRRRGGRPEVGEELAHQLDPHLRDG